MTFQFDEELDISVGKSRKELNWKHTKFRWSELVKKVSKTHRTAETFKEYNAAHIDRQGEIKDIGGFVGGLINGGRRKKGSVIYRQLLTLDIDKGTSSFWTEYTLTFGYTAALYTTHKHSPAKPRYRLLIPLTRPVQADEYEAIGRRIAGDLDIDIFDPTTFEFERLMFWPSTSKDGEFIFEYTDGDALDPDEVLEEYADWKDTSQWPFASGLGKEIRNKIKTAGDPLEKDGLVGTFCRCYNPIHEAIEEFLSEDYEKTGDNRYTYKKGSTANGLIIYEDKFAYSHHGTDPASGKLCNAWDLVRLHKFKNLDNRAGPETLLKDLPSQVAMLSFAAKDKKVKYELGLESTRAIEQEFGIKINPKGEEGEKDNNKWTEELERNNRGRINPTIDNIVLILNNDPFLKDSLAYNEFRNHLTVRKNLPWRKLKDQYEAEWKNSDDAAIRHYFEKIYQVVHRTNIQDGLDIVFKQNSFHPVKDYLESLKWDKVERAEKIFIDYLGASDNSYTRAVTIKMLCAAVARVYQPGIKFDNVVMLIGKQGTGKSTIIKQLGKYWYSDSFGSLQNKSAEENLHGVWIMEIGELAGLKKAEVEEIKHFISKTEDSFRPAYGRTKQTFPRQGIFIASTNENTPLVDKTGNRRFWVVNLFQNEPKLDIFTGFTEAVVDQVWAEVVRKYKQGMDLYLGASLERTAAKIQHRHTEEYKYGGLILAALDKLIPAPEVWDKMNRMERRAYYDPHADDSMMPKGTEERTEICSLQVWNEIIGLSHGSLNNWDARELNSFLRNLEGWEEAPGYKTFIFYGKQRYYRKKDTDGTE